MQSTDQHEVKRRVGVRVRSGCARVERVGVGDCAAHVVWARGGVRPRRSSSAALKRLSVKLRGCNRSQWLQHSVCWPALVSSTSPLRPPSRQHMRVAPAVFSASVRSYCPQSASSVVKRPQRAQSSPPLVSSSGPIQQCRQKAAAVPLGSSTSARTRASNWGPQLLSSRTARQCCREMAAAGRGDRACA